MLRAKPFLACSNLGGKQPVSEVIQMVASMAYRAAAATGQLASMAWNLHAIEQAQLRRRGVAHGPLLGLVVLDLFRLEAREAALDIV